MDPGSLFALLQLAAARSTWRAQASAIIKKRQPFTSLERPEELEVKTQGNDTEALANGQRRVARGLLQGGKRRTKEKKALGVGVTS